MSKAFDLVREETIPELNSVAKLYVHRRTGARLLSVINEDDNKVFSINFRTTPKDSTGVPHILEHCVLNGSEKYPLKDPFAELKKGSLQTFLNAFTFPDKTCYPVASQNVQDFYNLIDVYMDAVLHPLISRHAFMQEGWHYDIDDAAQPLTFKGIVFNEMKGTYSSPDDVLETRAIQSLFPKHLYGLDAGGDPRLIPELTYESFRAFWEKYYHPSNAFIYFYGNDDPEMRLTLMERYLKPYKKKKIRSLVPPAKPFKRPKSVEYPYDAGEEQDIEDKHFLTVNWKLPDTSDAVLNFSLRILGHILIGTPASPLRKALLESGLGEDLAGFGLETEIRYLMFSTGLKGTRRRRAKKIERLILQTLQSLARDGIDPDTVAASMNTIEFRLRENNTGSYPAGLALMRRVMTTWIYDEDPFKLLGFELTLSEIKSRLTADPRYFENLIQAYFLENTHRTTLRLRPDPEMSRRLEQDEKNRLAKIRASLSESQLVEFVQDTQALRLRQDTPDSPQALETLPVLKLEDIEKNSRNVPIQEFEIHESKILYHDLFTNGIVYLDLGFDLHTLPTELLPLTEIFGRALFEMGTTAEDYITFSQRIGKSTGGVHASAVSISAFGSRESVLKLFVRGKATMDQAGELLNIIRDALLTANFDDRKHIKQIILEEKAGMEAGLTQGGAGFVNTRLRAQFGESGWANEEMRGIRYLFALRELANDVDRKWKSLLRKLETMRELLVNRSTLICNVTLDHANWSSLQPLLESFLMSVPQKPAKLFDYDIQPAVKKEGLAIPSQVNFVGKGANLYDLGYQLDGSTQVITEYLASTHLWDKIRAQGGAYGAHVIFDDRSGVLTFVSYRDPNIVGTFENFDASADFLKGLDSTRLSEKELTKAIIAAIGDLDAHQLPDAKGFTSMIRYLTHRSDEMRQRTRDQVLSTNGEDFIAFGELLEKAARSNSIAVMGSQSALENANVGLEVTKVL